MDRSERGGIELKITANRFPGGLAKALTFSYDDGVDHDRRLVEIFNRYGMKATFHLISGSLDKPGFLRADEVKALFSGHEVSGHSVNHPHLTLASKETLVAEVWNDRKQLEQLVGYPVKGMSYPYGTYNDEVVRIISSLGMDYARTAHCTGEFTMPDDFLRWAPTCHHDDNLLQQGERFLEEERGDSMLLFYVFGHSHDFDRKDNWELIEQFCEQVAGRTDVWYATNHDIVAYQQAVQRLEYSASGTIIYNPSALSVWISVDEQSVELPAGKTTVLG
ncbi:polysaccharide deacetylase [Paenibacillus baekrokdamisoli]|uniref:Polysaccharide deacetylase n=1 Tax=Paenibacillus baekrokdamisoli TaxID=1712516 RepID=A0A3G9IYV1_9BACL|nr:polysaccharide deacetylase family protein [Paenibacillus baekrokdamisoli]MBB3071910.1 hypothetical protein [Paenibacillus baekrokdamisoli]BBH24107.1 polysaccharide deacetylase [Paenibacillus baekrokdamisoli]